MVNKMDATVVLSPQQSKAINAVIQIESEEDVEVGDGSQEMEGSKPETPGKKRKERKIRPKRPNSTFKKIIKKWTPQFIFIFLFCEHPQAFKYSKFLLGMGVGGCVGLAIYLALISSLEVSPIYKVSAGYFLAAFFGLGWAISKHMRCTCLVIVPNILGKEGRAYLFVFVLAAIFAGPGANLQHNFKEIPRSIVCTAELQVNNTKMLWKIVSTPVQKILKNIMSYGQDIKKTSKDVKVEFNKTNNEVASREGYDKEEEREELKKEPAKKSWTQYLFELKNMLRCKYVVEVGIDKCHQWFDRKHDECMTVIKVPIINHLLCWPMKMKFLCNILHVASPWCKKHIPVEGKFGDVFDRLNSSVGGMDKGFAVKVDEKDKEKGFIDSLRNKTTTLSQKLKHQIEQKKAIMKNVVSGIRIVMAFTFVFLFLSAYQYTVQYNKDIRYDNNYITTYFRQIDARRKKKNKRYLLPLKKGETAKFIFPWSLAIQGPEMKSAMLELLQCIVPIILLTMSLICDKVLVHILEIIRRHSKISYNFASHHHLEVSVGGESFIANFLRRTIGLLNSSSNTVLTSNNDMCLPKPIHMMGSDYLWACWPVVGYVCLSLCQVYFSRLRRVIASYYFPKREKRRVIFLYNQQLRHRMADADMERKRIIGKAKTGRLQSSYDCSAEEST